MGILNIASLKDLDSSHFSLVLRWRNQEQIRSVMIDNRIITKKDHKKWIENIQHNNDRVVKVFHLGDKPIGVVQITNISFENQTCDWGFYIGAPDSPKGSGTIMGYLTLQFVFENLRMRKISAQVLDFNSKSIRYHKKFGFQTEGILREQILRDGRYVDLYIMSLFKNDWLEIRKGIEEKIEGMSGL